MSHSFGKVLMAGHIASGSVTAVDGRIPKIVDNLAVVRPTIMAAVPRIFEKVYNRIIETSKQGAPIKQRIFELGDRGRQGGQQVRQQGREPRGLLAIQSRLADKLVFDEGQGSVRRPRALLHLGLGAAVARDRRVLPRVRHPDPRGLRPHRDERGERSSTGRSRYAFGTVGMPMPGTEVKLAPEDGEILIRVAGRDAGLSQPRPTRPPRRSRPTAGCAPATSARSTRAASCASPIARRT